MEEIVNKVAKSGLITLDLEEFVEKDIPRKVIDLKDHIYEGMLLREKEFRDFIKSHDWNQYEGTYVAIHCSSEAIIPTWAYMLVTSRLESIALDTVFGVNDHITEKIFEKNLNSLDLTQFSDAKVVIKGCGDFHIPESCYVAITQKLAPIVSSLMYGEPCSTVPVMRRRKNK